jgi:dTMP kinase
VSSDSKVRPGLAARSSELSNRDAKGKFITLEGGEGAGKSTQQKLLLAALARAGKDAIATREPGGAKGADEIRALLLNGPTERWDPISEAMLMVAARRCHLVETVWPTLDAGKWVVCDRFADSTTAYQGYGGGLDRDQLAELHRLIADDFRPDLTLIFDVPVEIGLARAAKRHAGEARFEAKGRDYHERVRQGFLAIAAQEPERCVVIDASQDVDKVGAAALAALRGRLGLAV